MESLYAFGRIIGTIGGIMSGVLHRTIKHIIWITIAAVILVAVCRTYIFESYRVAPLQMEKTLMAGDRIIVEKYAYGIRMPQTIFSLPFIDTIPGTAIAAYYPQHPLSYKRIFMQQAQRNDVIVYNYPYDSELPISRYPTAIARCIGTPGDTIQAIDGKLYINGKATAQSPVVTEAYFVADSLLPQIQPAIEKQLGKMPQNYSVGGITILYIDRYNYNKIISDLPDKDLLQPINLTHDNYNIELPPIDSEAIITPRNARFFATIINRYEPEKVNLHGDKLYRGGRCIERYKFSQPYYWVLCDNRIAATDSRTFGVLPHSHIIGRCSMILFSTHTQQNSTEWHKNRLFQPIMP